MIDIPSRLLGKSLDVSVADMTGKVVVSESVVCEAAPVGCDLEVGSLCSGRYFVLVRGGDWWASAGLLIE